MEEQYQQYSDSQIRNLQQDSWNRYVLENKELLEDLSHILKGEIQIPTLQKDSESGETAVVMLWTADKKQDPPMNEKGYYYTMQQLFSALNKTNSTGNVEDEKAMLLVNHICKAIITSYVIKHEEFDLQGTGNMRSIITSIRNLLIMHFSKSVKMKLISALTTSTNVSEIRQQADLKPQPNITA